jgi:uncharacterized membrane protein YbaN (DUF454 family)
MNTKANRIDVLPSKLLACLLALVCVVVGTVGLVLPIIPGFLFLILAVLIVARHFPTIETWLRKSRRFDRHMDRADSFMELPVLDKVRVSGLICVKIVLDTLAFVGGVAGKVLDFAAGRGPYSR